MAIACECLSVLIPIKNIDTQFPGGFVMVETPPLLQHLRHRAG
jgi:hypothetical protein